MTQDNSYSHLKHDHKNTPIILGHDTFHCGHVTKLSDIFITAMTIEDRYGLFTRRIEKNIGYPESSLNDGFHFLVLQQRPYLEGFELRGDTSMSDEMAKAQNAEARRDLNVGGFIDKYLPWTGRDRIVKIVPVNQPDSFERGRGAGQWLLIFDHLFFVAAEVRGSKWTLADRFHKTTIDVSAPPDSKKPIQTFPLERIMWILEKTPNACI